MFEVCEADREGRTPRLDLVATALMKFASIKQEEDSDPFGDMLRQIAKQAMMHGYPARISDELLFFSNLHFKERSSHINTLVTGMQLFRIKAVAAVTQRSDFSLAQLRQRPTAIYIKFGQADAKAFGPLTAIFLESLFAWALDTPAGKKDQSVLVVGEEWASLPVIPLVFDALAKGNGMGLHLMIVLQELAQFKEKYKQEGVDQLITNCTYLLAFTQANPYTAKTLTGLVGKTTRTKRTHSKQVDKFFGSTNVSQEGVPLIREEQWGEIPFGRLVVLAQQHYTRPILCKAAFWDKDRHMSRLIKRGARR
jgi:type IV secretion system protein VirD4